MNNELKHEYEDKIKCPYCDYEFGDSWEYIEDGSGISVCEDCEKDFNLEVIQEVTYSTTRIGCDELESPEEHEYNKEDYEKWNVTQDTCDRWNAEKFCNKTDHTPHTPHTYWKRICIKCGDESYTDRLLPGSECPW